MSPRWGLDTKTYWLTGRQSQRDFDFDFDRSQSENEREREREPEWEWGESSAVKDEGFGSRLWVIVINCDSEKSYKKVLINPIIQPQPVIISHGTINKLQYVCMYVIM
jgi:hypothetical protein